MMSLVRFDAYMEDALYGPAGFYAAGRGAGTTRDFLTSPEVGSLFGAVLARRLDEEWHRLGQPTEFRVVEVGAGPGTLCRTIFAAQPACVEALRYDLVDRAEGMRALHAAHLPALQTRSLATIPSDVVANVVLGNEILDNVPFRLMHWDGEWKEVHVRIQGTLVREELVTVDPLVAADLSQLVPSPSPDSRIPYQERAADFVGELLASSPTGLIILVDYARVLTADFAALPQGDWLRTYDRHRRGTLGGGIESGSVKWVAAATDITVDVSLDQMQRQTLRPPVVRTQHAALKHWGLDEVLAESARNWAGRPSDFHLPSLRFRSHASEAVVLCDPLGLGGFTVLEWPGL
jgi:SAM-dependent MidA family methyltransferase